MKIGMIDSTEYVRANIFPISSVSTHFVTIDLIAENE